MTVITKVKNAFLDSLYFLLDGLVHLAFSDPLLPDGRGSTSREGDTVNANDAVRISISPILTGS
jgi:hypothetical protein